MKDAPGLLHLVLHAENVLQTPRLIVRENANGLSGVEIKAGTGLTSQPAHFATDDLFDFE